MTNDTSSSRQSIASDPATISICGEDSAETLMVQRGTTVEQLLKTHPKFDDGNILAAVVDNRMVSLKAHIIRSGDIRLIKKQCSQGARLYQRHLSMMMHAAFISRYGHCKIQIGQAISEGHYFKVKGVTVDDTFVKHMTADLKEMAAAKIPFIHRRVTLSEARRLFSKKGEPVKRKLLEQWPDSHVSIVDLNGYTDLCFSPAAPHTGLFDVFHLFAMDDETFVLQFPDHSNGRLKRNTQPQPKLYETHIQAKKRSQLLGVAHIAELNQVAISKRIKEVINIAEGLHEKQLADIAAMIMSDKHKLVFIAGPSSAGKTTFAKRLSIQLKVAGVEPIALSLDNYYVDRDDTPIGEDGKKDFEALEAIDLNTFNDHLRRILDGETVKTPVFNFQSGMRGPQDKWKPISLDENHVLIIEGIHGLNPALTPSVGADEKFKIYINALNPLAIDEHNRLNTSDVRLIRRIVRDRHYRGYQAAQTINNWHSVRRGERNHIYPFQEEADVIFDTSLIYEFSVLKIYAERYLMEVPRTDPAFPEAYRLRKFISMLITVLPGDVPHNSIMREFIGGSNFSY